MTPRQIHLVQASFGKVLPMADAAAEIFYNKLFDLNPGLRPLFRSGDMPAQGKKLMTMLNTVINGLGELEKMVPAIQDLGRKHVGYGVRDRDYETVGEALLWTLGKGLGEDFTPEVRDAWESVYGLLADAMKGAPLEQEIQPGA